MICSGIYNPVKDLHEVDQFGFVDLVESVVEGIVQSYVGESEDSYNGIDDPSTIIGKPRDVFEAARYQDMYHQSIVDDIDNEKKLD